MTRMLGFSVCASAVPVPGPTRQIDRTSATDIVLNIAFLLEVRAPMQGTRSCFTRCSLTPCSGSARNPTVAKAYRTTVSWILAISCHQVRANMGRKAGISWREMARSPNNTPVSAVVEMRGRRRPASRARFRRILHRLGGRSGGESSREWWCRIGSCGDPEGWSRKRRLHRARRRG